jgi:hypothetical protein
MLNVITICIPTRPPHIAIHVLPSLYNFEGMFVPAS